MEREVRYCTTDDGVRIAYCVEGDGPAVVFSCNIWGGAYQLLNWIEQQETIERICSIGIRALVYDDRGMGLSDRRPADFSLSARLRDLAAVVDHAGLDEFVLWGKHFGSPAAVAYAAEHTGRVSHLILDSAFARGADYVNSTPAMRALTAMRVLAQQEWEFYTLTTANTVMGYADQVQAEVLAKVMRGAMSPEAFIAFREAALDVDVREFLRRVRAPTLVLHNSSSRLSSLESSQEVASAIQNARLVVASEDEPLRVVAEFLGLTIGTVSSRAEPSYNATPHGTAIILFADIVDSTALTERLGDAAFRDKARDLDAALRTVIRENAGTAIEGKLLGDGVLAVFTSARQAIEAALACGRTGDEMGLPLHLGLHAGDVIRENDNVFGGAVNIASRISGLSGPGEVLVSDTVRSLARTSAGVRFEDRGEQALKGIDDPVRVFAVSWRT